MNRCPHCSTDAVSRYHEGRCPTERVRFRPISSGFVLDGVTEKQYDQRRRLNLPIATDSEKSLFREIQR